MDVVYTLFITFILLPIIFLILFLVFLIRSIKRGKRIKELEKELYDLKNANPGQVIPNAYNPYMMPQQGMMPGMGQPQYAQMPEIQPQGYMPQPVQPQITQPQPVQPQYYAAAPATAFIQQIQTVQSNVGTPTQSDAGTPTQPNAATKYQPNAGIPPQPNPVTPPQTNPAHPANPINLANQPNPATPSWALSPEQARAKQLKDSQTQAVQTGPEPKKRFFSSINITFGIGVLLLTMVGATFMTGSWPWMTEEVRAVCLFLIVFIVYGMAFFAGKILKLQQTEFALYTLASLLGPIVIVGIGSFNLLGSAFSFSGGTGWLVATVAALILTVTAVGGRFLFREKTQANIYQGTFYIALTWLVVFLCGQIGQASGGITEWGMICLGLSMLALVFRIVAATSILDNEVFFRIYSEIILYIVAGLLLCTSFLADGALFGAAIIEFVAFVLFAVFSRGKTWIKYLVPFAGMIVTLTWIVFGDKTDDIFLVSAITVVIIVVLYAVHKILKLSTVMSDLLFTISLGAIPTFLAFEKLPGMGVFSCFLTVGLLLFQMILEPVIAKKEFVPQGIFREDAGPVQVINTLLATAFYYLGIVMLYLTIEEFPFKGHFYYSLAALIPAVAALAYRFFVKDDLRIKIAGYVLSFISVVAALFSCFVISSLELMLYEYVNICSWILTLAVIVMALFFMVKPLKEKRLSFSVMFWTSVCLNALAIGVFMTAAFYNWEFRVSEVLRNSDVLSYRIASLVFLGLNTAAVGASSFIKRKGKDIIKDYASGMKYFFAGFAMLWFIRSAMFYVGDWKLIIISVVFAVLLTVFDSEFFAVVPVLFAEYSIVNEFMKLENHDLINFLCIISALVFAGLGRLVFRKKVFTSKSADYLSLTSFLFLFGLNNADYVPMVVFLSLALLVMNFAGRVKIPVRVIVSVFAALVCIAVVLQPFLDYPEVIALEVNIILMLGTLLLICRVIRPAPEGTMKYIWFTGISLALIAEGVSAAVTGEVLDLVIVGTASFGIFIFAFIRRNRLWFILGIVSMVSVAVYLSLAFWSSLVWLIYLFVAGTILVVMASVNEWGKRHNKDGKKKRFFEEWTW